MSAPDCRARVAVIAEPLAGAAPSSAHLTDVAGINEEPRPPGDPHKERTMDTEALRRAAAPSAATDDRPETSPMMGMLTFLRRYARNFLGSRLLDERRSLPPAM